MIHGEGLERAAGLSESQCAAAKKESGAGPSGPAAQAGGHAGYPKTTYSFADHLLFHQEYHPFIHAVLLKEAASSRGSEEAAKGVRSEAL
jgi:hypothetical protein